MSEAKKISRWLPWLLTIAALAYMFLAYDLRGVVGAVLALDWGLFLLLLGLGVVIPWFFDALGFWVAFSRLWPSYQWTLSDMLPARAISYFLNIVNYSAAGGGVALFLQKRKGVPFLEALSCFLFLLFIDLLVVSSVLVIGLSWSGVIPATTRVILWFMAGGVFLLFFGELVYWNGKFDFWFAGRFRSWAIFSSFAKATLRDYGAIFLVRLALFIVYLFVEFPLLRLFGVRIPVDEFLVYFPVLVFISILPISVASLGAPQEATIRLYAPFVLKQESIFAYSMSKVVLFNIARILLGGFFLWRTQKQGMGNTSTSSVPSREQGAGPEGRADRSSGL